MKRKKNLKHKKQADDQNSANQNESSSSSSDDEDENSTNPETNNSDVPVSNIEETQSITESTASSQQNEKIDIRKHIRHRRAHSSDDEQEKM